MNKPMPMHDHRNVSETSNSSVNHCPFHENHTQQSALDPEDTIFFPNFKRVVAEYTIDESGMKEFHIYYGQREVCFDDPELFDFGEELAKHEYFIAQEATTWGNGYQWTQIKDLLDHLINEGILDQASPNTSNSSLSQIGSRPSLVPPSKSTTPRMWYDECAKITHDLTGRSTEVGYLESIIPIYRIVHIALDAEGRQIGEANAFPTQLRLDVPTTWRTCLHPGSRFQDDKPMNVTALKSIRMHWKQTLAALHYFREAYLRRFPKIRQQGWTVGDLERLSTQVLALPAFLMMKKKNRIENGHLHPVLSSMFRVTDGIRMTMHYMLFIAVDEPTLPPDTVVTSNQIYAYAERNAVFISDYGVCAGPKAMIEELLHVLIDGEPVDDAESVVLDEAVISALDAIESAFDYGFYGLQVNAVTSSLWNRVARTYEQILSITERWPEKELPAFITIRNQMVDLVDFVRSHTYVGTEEWRINNERAYSDMYAQATSGLGQITSKTALTDRLTPVWTHSQTAAKNQLYRLLQKRFDSKNIAANSILDDLTNCLMSYFLTEQGVLRAATEIQYHINQLLGRQQPLRQLTAKDLYFYYQVEEEKSHPPYLINEVMKIIGIEVAITQESIEIIDCLDT